MNPTERVKGVGSVFDAVMEFPCSRVAKSSGPACHVRMCLCLLCRIAKTKQAAAAGAAVAKGVATGMQVQ